MQQQKLCLKWNNHTINLLSVLETFQQKDILVDVTLSCEGRNIKAHKMVLSACSPYFQSIFLENPCQHPIVIINGMKFEDITAILNFMYKGEVNVSHEGLSSFLQAAEALKVKGLAEVCGEKRGSNSNSQEAEPSEQARPQRTDTPTKKRHRNRKRSFSDSNRSDDEGAPRKQKEINSPEVHELSGDESYTGDMSSNGQSLNSRVPQNVYSRSHQSSSNITAEDIEDEYEMEPTKMLEQTLTENANNTTSSDNGLRIERIVGNAPDMESSSLQEPESPPDIKPIIEYGESSIGPSEGNMLVYNEQSQPGPSNMQDGSLLHDNSHTQERNKHIIRMLEILKLNEKISSHEWRKQATKMLEEIQKRLNEHTLLLNCRTMTHSFDQISEEAANTAIVLANLPGNTTEVLGNCEAVLDDTTSFEFGILDGKKIEMAMKVKQGECGDSMFVKNLATAVWGNEELANRSVTGQKCNAKKESSARPALTPWKITWIEQKFVDRMKEENAFITDEEIQRRCSKINKYLAEKIATLNKKFKK